MRKIRKLLKYAIIASLLSSVFATQGCGNTTVTTTSVVEETVTSTLTSIEKEPEVSTGASLIEVEPDEDIDKTETSVSVEEEPVIEEDVLTEEEQIKEEPETKVVEELIVEEKEPELTYEPYEVTLYCHKEVNVRETPSSKGKKVGSIKVGEEVKVIGKDKETGWYLLENGNYCSNDKSYLKKEKYVAPKEEKPVVDNKPSTEPVVTPTPEPKKEEPKPCTHSNTREETGEKKWLNISARCHKQVQMINVVCNDCGILISTKEGATLTEDHPSWTDTIYTSGGANETPCGEHCAGYHTEKCECGAINRTFDYFDSIQEHGYWIGQEFTKQEGYDRVWYRPYTCINCGDYYEEETSRDVDYYKPAEPEPVE